MKKHGNPVICMLNKSNQANLCLTKPSPAKLGTAQPQLGLYIDLYCSKYGSWVACCCWTGFDNKIRKNSPFCGCLIAISVKAESVTVRICSESEQTVPH